MRATISIAVVLLVAVACAETPAPLRASAEAQSDAPVPVYGYDVVKSYPHDARAFTQGLIVRDGFLYESTGINGESTLRKVELDTGRVLQQRKIDDTIFAEGLTEWRGKLVQITWTTRKALVYNLQTFAPQSTFSYEGEGWGITHDDTRLIMSDGTQYLRFLEPDTGRQIDRVAVTSAGSPVQNLNELEFVRGQVYANVWHTDRIAMIDPVSGRVAAWLDLQGLRPVSTEQQGEAVLNGIAYDAGRDRLFVTGKWWPALFEIRVRQNTAR